MSSVKKVSGEQAGQYYDAILDATGPKSPGGANVTPKEFEAAEAKIRKAPKAEQQKARGDAVEFLGDSLAAEARRSAENGGADEGVREENALARLAALKKLMAGPERGKVYTKAHEIAATQEGIATAIYGQVDATADAGAARDRLIALVRDTTDLSTLQVVRSAWVHLLGDHRRLDSGAVDKLAQVIEAATATLDEAVGAFAQDAVAEMLTPMIGKEEASASVKQRSQSTKIGGKDEATIAREIDEIVQREGTGRLLYDEDRMRVAEYRELLASLYSNPEIKAIVPEIVRIADRQEMTARAARDQVGVILDARAPRSDFHGVNKAAYDLLQEVGRELGSTSEVALAIDPSPDPNAWINTASMDFARVTVTMGLLDELWSYNDNKWISVPVDKQGAPVAAGTPGAQEYEGGRLRLASVLAHELGHIRDQVVITDTLLVTLMEQAGVDLLKQVEQGTPAGTQIRAALESRYGSVKLLDIVRDPSLPKIPQSVAREALQTVFPALSKVWAAAGDKKDDPAMDAFMEHFNIVSLAAETTADRYPVAVQGDPRPTLLTQLMLALPMDKGTSDADKMRRLREHLEQDPLEWAQGKLDRALDHAYDDELAAHSGRTHPFASVRILNANAFARESDLLRDLNALRDLPAGERLLALMQVYEQATAVRQEARAAIQPQEAMSSHIPWNVMNQLTHEIGELGEKLGVFEAYFADLLKADGLGGREGVYVDRALDFMENAGATLPHVAEKLYGLLEEARAKAKGNTAARIDARLDRAAALLARSGIAEARDAGQASAPSNSAGRSKAADMKQHVALRLGRLAD